MITGFNTDIEFGGVTYHVQTEDKGISKPIILSLVYDRGTILASKRVSYEDLLAVELDEKVLSERLQKQHRLICAAIQAGRIEDLKRMTAEAAAKAKRFDEKLREIVSKPLNADADPAKHSFVSGVPAPDIQKAPVKSSPEPEYFLQTMVDGVTIIDEIILPAEAVAIVSEMEGIERPANNKLSIEILGETKFRGGERRTVGFMVCRGNLRKVVTGAQIMVKVLGSSFRPVIFHASTDSNGLAMVNLQLPNFNSGRAAFLVRAMSDGEEIELRRSITHA